MNIATMSLAYLRAGRSTPLLILLLLALGTATITLLLLASAQLEERMGRDARGIDLVVGAKGSPMQLILSAVYHLDIPTGNIPLSEAQRARKAQAAREEDDPALARRLGEGVPHRRHQSRLRRALRRERRRRPAVGEIHGNRHRRRRGDAYRLGRSARASPARTAWKKAAAHHGDHPFRVVGVLARTGSVLDRLILTSLESVWDVHARADYAEGRETDAAGEEKREITALLDTVRLAACGRAAAALRQRANRDAGGVAGVRERAAVRHLWASAFDVRARCLPLILIVSAARQRLRRALQRVARAALRPRDHAHARIVARAS